MSEWIDVDDGETRRTVILRDVTCFGETTQFGKTSYWIQFGFKYSVTVPRDEWLRVKRLMGVV